MQSLICMIVPFAHTHTAHPYICTNLHTYIHNCEGVKKAYSLVKNESNQRPPVLFSSHLFSLISSLDSTDNTLFQHQHHTTLPSPTTINYFFSMLLEAASSAVGWRSPCSHWCACVCEHVCSYEQPVHVYACTCVHVYVWRILRVLFIYI